MFSSLWIVYRLSVEDYRSPQLGFLWKHDDSEHQLLGIVEEGQGGGLLLFALCQGTVEGVFR